MDERQSSDTSGVQLGRRSFLAKSAVAAAAGGLFLASCGGSTPSALPGVLAAPSSSGESTLDKVIAAKKLRLGILVSDPPYGSYDQNNKPVGIDMDVANLLATDLGVSLAVDVLPDSATRVTALVAGKIDVAIAAFTMTPQRSQSVAFSTAYAPDTEALLGRKSDTNLHTYEDYSGKKVAVATGTIQAEFLPKLNPKIICVTFPDDNTGLQAFRSGQVDAWTSQLETVEKLASQDPTLEVKGTIFNGYLSIGCARNDLEFLRWINDALYWHGGRTGELGVIYKKWVGTDMPHVLPNY